VAADEKRAPKVAERRLRDHDREMRRRINAQRFRPRRSRQLPSDAQCLGARREGLPKRYVTRLARLAFVSPVVAEAVAAGHAPAAINLQMLVDGRLALPLDWKDQQLML
jgi:hypothetical protein